MSTGIAQRTGKHLLDTGFHLSQPEFHRRYELAPEIKKAELIEGVVIMGSPVTYNHAQATGAISGWLLTYAASTPGVRFAENASVILDADNEVQPDGTLILGPERGGQTCLKQNKYLEGAPELVVEVALSSVAYDLHEKFHVYRRNRVREYLVWQLDERKVDWFFWEDGEYLRMKPAGGALYCSLVFPGLCLDTSALLSGDFKRVLAQLNKSMRGASYKQFLKRLSSK